MNQPYVYISFLPPSHFTHLGHHRAFELSELHSNFLLAILLMVVYMSREGNGNPLQYSCLENLTDREAWRAIVHEVAKSWTRLSDCTELTVSSHEIPFNHFSDSLPPTDFTSNLPLLAVTRYIGEDTLANSTFA